MSLSDWISAAPESLLDVGCNVGAWLSDCKQRYPNARLAGVDINTAALQKARERLPDLELHEAGGEKLPFPDESFQYVTCVEVMEHVPPELRAAAFREIRRVLKSGGRLILTTPHAGWFQWMDSNNLRFRLPGLYRKLLGKGKRDESYENKNRHVEWHYHFVKDELLQLAGSGYRLVNIHYRGLFLCAMMDCMSWPFYRTGRGEHPIRKMFERISGWDMKRGFGRASYNIALELEKISERT